MISTNSYANIHDRYVAAIAWMRGLGIALGTGRTLHYERVMLHWRDRYRTATAEEVREAYPDFISSSLEIHEFLHIHKAFAGEPVANLGAIAEKLQKAVNGPVNAGSETPASTAARNFLFEAATAAKVHHPDRGLKAILDVGSDTAVSVDGRTVWVECKRVTSAGKLEHNLRKACSQLAGSLANPEHRGLVAVDISKLFNSGDKILRADNDADLTAFLQQTMHDFVEQHIPMWERIYAIKHEQIIGTIFRLSCMAVSEERNLLVHAAQWVLSPRRDAAGADLRLLVRMAEALGDGE